MYFKFGRHPRPGYYDNDGKFVTASTSQPNLGTVRPHSGARHVATANSGMMGSGSNAAGVSPNSFGDGGGNFGGAGPTGQQDRYNSVRDRLDEGSVAEDWIPRDAAGLDRMFRLMYHRDPIAGTIVDIICDLIWSEFDLVGVKDNAIKKVYEDCLNAIDPLTILPDITRDYLVLGRSVNSLIFDEQKGIFRDVVSHDPDFVRLKPIPIKGFDPKIDLIPSPNMREFIESVDPRDADARKVLPEAYLAALRKMGNAGGGGNSNIMMQANPAGNMAAMGEGVPLDPINTLFVARRVFSYDHIGTSLYTRLISFWALEKALINATVTSARRRSRAILHVKAGIDNLWEPTAAEMDAIAGLFIAADDDPVGAVVATRTGVEANEIRPGAEFYKWSDEWTLLTEGKLRALGANDALLTGDATYTNQESAKTMFMEKAKSIREYLTKRVIYKRLFTLIARVHGFRKTTTANVNNGIVVKPSRKKSQAFMDDPLKTRLTQRESLSIPESELIMPTLAFHKELVYSIDEKKLEVFEKMEEKGVPISLRNWAAAGNIDLDAEIADLQSDALLRRKVNEWKAKSEVNPEAEARFEFVKSLQDVAQSQLQTVVGKVDHLGPLSSYLFWNAEGAIGSLKAKDMNVFMSKIDAGDNSALMLGDFMALSHRLLAHFKDSRAAQAAHYLMFKTGLTLVRPALSSDTVAMLADAVKSALDRYTNNGSVYELGIVAKNELDTITGCAEVVRGNKVDKIGQTTDQVDRRLNQSMPFKKVDRIPATSKKLWSGRTND